MKRGGPTYDPDMRRVALVAVLALAFIGARQRAVRIVPPPFIAGPTFNKEVVRIFQDHCQTCHHPGDIGPFSLMTFADAFPNATNIKLMTRTHQMPPWKPSTDCGSFAEARVLTQDEIDVLSKWVDNGAPEGNPADLPQPLDFQSGWALGQPDLVLSSAQPYTPPATGDMYRCFTMPTDSTSDQYVAAIDVHPGDRQTVHHVIAFIDTTGESAKLADAGGGYQCFGGPGFAITNVNASTLGGWAPGARPVKLPEGVGFLLPKNSRVVLQVHYHPHGPAPQPDKTEIGIYYSKTKPTKLMRILPLINDTFTIPPGDSNYRVTASFDLPNIPSLANTHVWLIAPHMHLLGRKMHVDATLPSGQKQCLVTIDDWDFNWQGMYRYQNPIAVPAGSHLALEAFYDNSPDNWRNPNDPPKSVSWGEQTTDEMCIAFLGFTIDSENISSNHPVDTSWIPPIRQ
jgi:hypothetical protein